VVVIAVRRVHAPAQVLAVGQGKKWKAQEPAASTETPAEADESDAVHRVNDRSGAKKEHEPEPTHIAQSHGPTVLYQLFALPNG
jgi:hypothetical protein